MSTNTAKPASLERESHALPGWLMLFINLGLLVGVAAWIVSILKGDQHWQLFPAIFLEATAALLLGGYFTLQPNEARVLILFGDYKGTVRSSGFWWANPFYSHVRGAGVNTVKISLRARNFNSEKLKVNDKRGNPVEIAAVVVWGV